VCRLKLFISSEIITAQFVPKVYAGPSFGFLTGGKTNVNVDGVVSKTDTKDQIKNFDFGATAGAGLNFKVAPRTWLNTDVAYYQGLTGHHLKVKTLQNVTEMLALMLAYW
jgi:outer membrane protein W